MSKLYSMDLTCAGECGAKIEVTLGAEDSLADDKRLWHKLNVLAATLGWAGGKGEFYCECCKERAAIINRKVAGTGG